MDKMEQKSWLSCMAFDADQKHQGYQIYPNVPITRKNAGLHKTRQEPLARHLAFPLALGQKWIVAPSLLGQLDVIVSISIGLWVKGETSTLPLIQVQEQRRNNEFLLLFLPIRISFLKISTFANDSGGLSSNTLSSYILFLFLDLAVTFKINTKIMAALPTPTSILDINAGAGTAQAFKGNTTKTFFSTLVTAVVIFAIEFGIFLLIKDKLSRI